MKVVGWLGIGIVAAVMIGFGVFAMPGAATSVQSFLTSDHGNPHQPEPVWSSGNLCSSITYYGKGDITCTSLISAAPYPLWWNFTEVPAETEHGTVTVDIAGSEDCINLNFHSFYTTIVVELAGSDYSCVAFAGSGGVPGSPSGVNIAVNSEGDSFSYIQDGSFYVTNITSYGTTTFASVTQWGSWDNTTVNYIGTNAGFATCPSGITAGRVAWSEVAWGSFDTFNSIFVDGTNVHHAPPNYGYSTEPLLPPDGNAYGYSDLYGNETTQTTPVGACAYIGV